MKGLGEAMEREKEDQRKKQRKVSSAKRHLQLGKVRKKKQ